jgi:hypothetical protein
MTFRTLAHTAADKSARAIEGQSNVYSPVTRSFVRSETPKALSNAC